jgi:hypothetical protein
MHFVLCAWGSRTALATRWSAFARAAAPSGVAAAIMLAGVEAARVAALAWSDAVRLPALVAVGAALYLGGSALLNRATMIEAWRLLRPRHATTS